MEKRGLGGTWINAETIQHDLAHMGPAKAKTGQIGDSCERLCIVRCITIPSIPRGYVDPMEVPQGGCGSIVVYMQAYAVKKSMDWSVPSFLLVRLIRNQSQPLCLPLLGWAGG